MNEFGIYILTHPGDFHLAVALVNSLRRFNPGVQVMIIPGHGFDHRDKPFRDLPIMPIPEGFWRKQDHVDRKFWAFQGPYQRFLYLDADVICLRSLSALINRIETQRGRFLYAQLPLAEATWGEAINEKSHPLHDRCVARLEGQLGNIDMLGEFDPEYSPRQRYPFNAGVFASSRETLTEGHFEELYSKETGFYSTRLRKPFTWRSHDLFFADQGRLNYLVARHNVRILNLYPHGHYLWGGGGRVGLEDVLRSRAAFAFIHWAGCPRPSPSKFTKTPLLRLLASTYAGLPEDYRRLDEVPGLGVWEYFFYDGRERLSAFGRVWWSSRDAKRIAMYYGRILFRAVKSCVKGTWP